MGFGKLDGGALNGYLRFYLFPGLEKNYDVALKRLQVHSSDNWKGIIPPTHNPAVQLPPIYSAKFCNQSGYHQFLALADEDGKVARSLIFPYCMLINIILPGGHSGHGQKHQVRSTHTRWPPVPRQCHL